VENVQKWFHDARTPQEGTAAQMSKGATAYNESQFSAEVDLMSLVPKKKPPLRRFLEQFKGWCRLIQCCCFRIKPLSRLSDAVTSLFTNNLQRKWHHCQNLYGSKFTLYQDGTWIDPLMTAIVTGSGLVTLIGAIWTLLTAQWQPNRMNMLSAISGFPAVFNIFLAAVTVTKPFGTLAATVVVAAVLMAVMQIGPRDSSGRSCQPCS
jgi:hypothetical protein